MTTALNLSLLPGSALTPSWPFGELETFSFDLIMADPPWRYELWSAKGQGKSADSHYRTMTTKEICDLPVSMLAARDSVLWLWATWPMLEHAQRVMRAWDFDYATGGAWHKRTTHGKTAFGTGYVLRSASELFLIGKRGEPKFTKSVRNLIDGRAREHSRKPEEAFRAAEALMPAARRIELFSREARPGWSNWGNEATKFNQDTSNEHAD